MECTVCDKQMVYDDRLDLEAWICKSCGNKIDVSDLEDYGEPF